MAKVEGEIRLLDGSVQHDLELVHFFNAGYDSGAVVRDASGSLHHVGYRAEHDGQGNVTQEWHQELPGYEQN